MGTPRYMSPEQATSARDVDHRADINSVGAILFRGLTGRHVHLADSLGDQVAAMLTQDAPSVSVLCPDVDLWLADGHASVRHGVELSARPFAKEGVGLTQGKIVSNKLLGAAVTQIRQQQLERAEDQLKNARTEQQPGHANLEIHAMIALDAFAP